MVIPNLFILIISFWDLNFQNYVQGNFIGIEERCFIGEKGKKRCEDKKDKKTKWFYLTQLHINGDSVYIEQSSISIRKQDTLYSASDGRYIYKGVIKIAGQGLIANIKLIYCDYCVTEVVNFKSGKIEKVDTHMEWTIKSVKDGLLVNNRLFKRL